MSRRLASPALARELQIDVVEDCIRPAVGVFVEKRLGFDADTAQRITKLVITQGSPVMKSYDHLDFPSEAAHLRSSDWAVVSSPAGPQDSRIGTTGPASPAKMAITALSSGAKVWLADRDDALRTDARLAVVVARDELLVKTCHHRNASANGGMADVIPNRPEPGVTAAQPLDTASAPGQVTEAGLCSTQCVAISCVAVWLSGSDAVAIHNLTEDAATAELRAPVGDDRVGDDLVGDDAFSAHYGPVGTVIADFLTTRADELLLQ